MISGNDRVGIWITNSDSTGNVIKGNTIGTNLAGTKALGNGLSGVMLEEAPSNTIDDNLISGNTQAGILLDGSSSQSDVIQGNLVGTDVTGKKGLFNGQHTIYQQNGASNNTVGGTTAATKNVTLGTA